MANKDVIIDIDNDMRFAISLGSGNPEWSKDRVFVHVEYKNSNGKWYFGYDDGISFPKDRTADVFNAVNEAVKGE